MTGALAQELREAAGIVARVAAGRSLSGELALVRDDEGAVSRAALTDLTHGTLRRYGRGAAIVRELSQRNRPDALVEALLWCSLYALESGRYTDYTVVDQAVRACGLLERWTAKGYVNALLRRAIREKASLEAHVAADEEARYQHPRWWIDVVRAAYPERWQEVLAAGNTHPPMSLRVNARRASLDAYQARLAAAGIESHRVADHALRLARPVPVDRLPGFSEGDVSVQDAGAQRAAANLDLREGQRVLDACAAPGGKAAHILETAAVALTAIDADAVRCARMAREFDRLHLHATLATADCTRRDAWWNGEPFDRILADVPCSASGIARRRPDVKWLRRAADLPAFAARQGAILDALWQVLGTDGKLLYVTCSVFPQENDAVTDAFVARTPGAVRLPLPDGGAAQSLPDADHDGFYYALIQKHG